jgi:hypothetical protein
VWSIGQLSEMGPVCGGKKYEMTDQWPGGLFQVEEIGSPCPQGHVDVMAPVWSTGHVRESGARWPVGHRIE